MLILRKDKYTPGVFQGVYPSDKLPKSVSSYPALFIAKVDMSDKPGSHWVVFYFTKDRAGEFCDFYGLPPSNYTGTFTDFLKNNSNQWIFNSVTLQSINSKVCGHFSLYYALFCCCNITMSTIVHRFARNKRRNDFLVKRFIEKHFPFKSKKIYPCKQTKIKSTAQSSVKTPCNFILMNFIE